MKLLLEDNKGNNLLIASPPTLPTYSIGTEVEVVVGYGEEGKIVKNGIIVGYVVRDDTEFTNRSYYVMIDDEDAVLVEENDIDMYYPSTNEFDLSYYLNGGDE